MKTKHFLFLIGVFLLAVTSVTAQDSIQKTYYPSGKLMKEISYTGGKKNGIGKQYYESGKLMWETHYTNDKENGIGKDYYENGKLMFETPYTNGKAYGISKGYYGGGLLKSETPYTDGKANGIEKGYYESGKLKWEVLYSDGKKIGIGKTYYESGQLMWETPYTGGKANGFVKAYYKSGELEIEAPYTNGLKNGVEIKYFKSGQLNSKTSYTNGTQNGIIEEHAEGTPVNDTQTNSSDVLYYLREIKIGTQTWAERNLDVSTFRNGDPIPHAQTGDEWKKAGAEGKPAWCYYLHNSAYGQSYGKLYNWYAVNDPRGLAPKGWHVPTDIEWTTLTDYLGGNLVAGRKMKTMSVWDPPANMGTVVTGTNESGFAGLPGGERNYYGEFNNMGFSGNWWSSTAYDSSHAWYRSLGCTYGYVYSSYPHKVEGLSVRCLKDQTICLFGN